MRNVSGEAGFEELDAALDHALFGLKESRGRLGILFSGGVDSSLLAWELRSRPDVVLYTLGRPGSFDLRAGEHAASMLGLPWVPLPTDRTEVGRMAETLAPRLRDLPPVSQIVLVTLGIALRRAESPVLVCGQGADELFWGYAHYRGLDAVAATRRAEADLLRLHETDWPRTQQIAAQFGRRVLAPYLDPAFESASLRVPAELRLPGNRPKGMFRDWARRRGLPAELAERPKKAAQYGSGVDALYREARRGAAAPD